ncbi:MAG TPA: hypothetical protein VLJ11_15925 [Bryobacteraceae bacterium]|nr:hypothetical protein [Bryobacteraceae bacterium]
MARQTKTRNNPIEEADLILKLYELRRETVMREARAYIGGAFLPSSVEDLVQIVTAGNQHSSFVLQVYGYWDMVAAFVLHGALSAELVYGTCQEMYFQYAKIQPYLAGFRETMDLPEWLSNVERVIDGSDQGRRRIETMRKNMDAIAQRRVASLLPS